MKRFLSLLLIATLLIPYLLTGCNENNNPIKTTPAETTESTTPEQTTPEETTPEETTPDEEENELPDGQKKLTDVTIVSGGTPAELTAAEDLQKYLTQKGVNANARNGFLISLSIDESLGEDAYCVTATVGKDKDEVLSIVGGNGRGILYGVYGFLEEYASVRFFTPELEVCEAGDVIIFDGLSMDYTPTFELRQTDWYRWKSDDSGYSWSVKNGINIVNGWNNYTWGEELGGCLSYAPSMFVHTIGKLAELDTPYPATAPNPCLTNEAIYQTVLKNVRSVLAQYPDFFSAAAPICGGGVSWYIHTKTPIRAYHGDMDDSVPLVYSQLMVDAVNARGGNAELTIYPGCTHNCWTRTYEQTDVIPWLAASCRR